MLHSTQSEVAHGVGVARCRRRKAARLTAVAALFMVLPAVGGPGASAATQAPAAANHIADLDHASDATLEAAGYRVLHPLQVVHFPDGGVDYVYDDAGRRADFPVPPAGFNPDTASSATLKRYGIPPRPTAPAEAARWERVWHYSEHYRTTRLIQAPFIKLGSTKSGTSLIYAGYYVTGASATTTFTEANGTYLEPIVQDSGACSTPQGWANWTGIGGLQFPPFTNGAALIQNGTMWQDNGPRDRMFWTSTTIPNVGPEVNQQDTIFSDTTYPAGTGTYSWYVHDDTTGLSWNSQEIVPNVNVTNADFITERPTSTDSGTAMNLASFGPYTEWFNNVEEHTNPAGGGSVGTDPNAPATGETMINPTNNHILAQTGPPGANGSSTEWLVTYSNCN